MLYQLSAEGEAAERALANYDAVPSGRPTSTRIPPLRLPWTSRWSTRRCAACVNASRNWPRTPWPSWAPSNAPSTSTRPTSMRSPPARRSSSTTWNASSRTCSRAAAGAPGGRGARRVGSWCVGLRLAPGRLGRCRDRHVDRRLDSPVLGVAGEAAPDAAPLLRPRRRPRSWCAPRANRAPPWSPCCVGSPVVARGASTTATSTGLAHPRLHFVNSGTAPPQPHGVRERRPRGGVAKKQGSPTRAFRASSTKRLPPAVS